MKIAYNLVRFGVVFDPEYLKACNIHWIERVFQAHRYLSQFIFFLA